MPGTILTYSEERRRKRRRSTYSACAASERRKHRKFCGAFGATHGNDFRKCFYHKKMPLDANFDILDGSEVKKRAYKTPKRAHMCIFPGIHSKTEVHTPASKLTCARRHTYSPEVSHTTARTRTYILYLRSGTQARRMLTYSSKTHIH